LKGGLGRLWKASKGGLERLRKEVVKGFEGGFERLGTEGSRVIFKLGSSSRAQGCYLLHLLYQKH